MCSAPPGASPGASGDVEDSAVFSALAVCDTSIRAGMPSAADVVVRTPSVIVAAMVNPLVPICGACRIGVLSPSIYST